MTARKQFGKQWNQATSTLRSSKKRLGKMGKAALAGVAGATIMLGNLGSSLKEKAADIKGMALHETKQSREVVDMKKSTLIALFVALAAVAGVLGALYFYVLRRERELDEYEQLLFSEDLNDDLMDDAEEPASEKGNA